MNDNTLENLSNNTFQAGISTELLDKLILDIESIFESIKKIHMDYESILSNKSQYFDCEFKDDFLRIHNTNDYYFLVLEQNILSYVSDIINLKQKYSSGIDNIAMDFRNK